MLNGKSVKLVGSVLCFLFMGMSNTQAQSVSAYSEMNFLDLRVSASNPSAELIWADQWYGSVAANAEDIGSVPDRNFTEDLGNNSNISALGSTDHVNSKAAYEVIFGDLVSKSVDASVQLSTHSDLSLMNDSEEVKGLAIADFDNHFVISGGNAGDSVDVTFELDYQASLMGEADKFGLFDISLLAFLLIEDDLVNALAEDIMLESFSGSDLLVQQDYTGTLSVTTQLLYGKEYWLLAGANAKVFGSTVPEPNIVLLLICGLLFLRWGKEKKLTWKNTKFVSNDARLLMSSVH